MSLTRECIHPAHEIFCQSHALLIFYMSVTFWVEICKKTSGQVGPSDVLNRPELYPAPPIDRMHELCGAMSQLIEPRWSHVSRAWDVVKIYRGANLAPPVRSV